MRILITAGPTREHLDAVRFISNASSGRMGYALAAEAMRRGHHVALVSGPVELPAPPRTELVQVVSGQEMLEACLRRFQDCDAAIMCAAVCDYRPVARAEGKTPKRTRVHRITLEPTMDICATLGARKGRRILIGFALESDEGRARAEAKLRKKHCDAIVLNSPAAIGGAAAGIEVFTPDGGWSAPRSGSKAELAAEILDLLERLAGMATD